MKIKKVKYDVKKLLSVRGHLVDLELASVMAKGRDREILKKALKRNKEIYSEYIK